MIPNMPDEYRSREVFQSELLADETIEWSGQPDPSKHFTAMDILLIPFSLMWGGFAVFWELAVLGFVFPSHGGRPPLFFVLWGIPFVAAGLYMIFGRFIYKAAKKRRTYYAVTNKRILVVVVGRNRNIQAAFIRDISTVNKKGGQIGTVVFGNSNGTMAMYANSGMEFFGGGMYGSIAPTFYDIHDADKVYQLVNNLRNQQSA